ncbi:pseudaminic acid synthase [Candidatus Peregrinibacteria bacterium]|nr:pseudaminic acid synthase [Candidatus Peregrinibacteria bacterium]MBI3816138.1 pseudaminic acid synthase [Candidatus Peregrinibacteria bacterium]
MSANHGQSKEKAFAIIHAMKEAGADAVKLQTYTPDTITIDCRNASFVDCLQGTLWEGHSLYELYGDAFTPWEWQADLKREAETLGMDCFSTPFDVSAVDFLETLHVPAYKVASFELIHLPLLRRIAKTGKPIILSTGMATREEIAEALSVVRGTGNDQTALLKCTSAYPATIEDTNLRTIPAMREEFGVPVGLSDHTPGSIVPVAAMTMGACIIEKHVVLDRERDRGPDSAFSMEPQEFRAMVEAVREAQRDPDAVARDGAALGHVHYGPTAGDKKSMVFRPSVFVVEDVKEGDRFTEKNLRIIRPGYGLPPREFDRVLGRKATCSIERGTPLTWAMVS